MYIVQHLYKASQNIQEDNQTCSKNDILNHQSSLLPYLQDVVYSSDSEFCDSGNSTAHSPDGRNRILHVIFWFVYPHKQMYNLVFHTEGNAPDSTMTASANNAFIQLELLEATHRALHKFIARHSDELELDIGDPIYVQKEAEDLWCEGNT